MEFRPCIDIHNGKVKQIVGSSLKDADDKAEENFVAKQDAAFYANLYKKKKIKNGHVILLNHPDSEYYEATKAQALAALSAYPKGLQIGGGITTENAASYLDAGASHVIVTSYVFQNGRIHYDNLHKLVQETGKENLVLDLSCRMKNGSYYIVTDRWQKYTDVCLNTATMEELAAYCDEFLIHAVDVEGKAGGIEKELVKMLGEWNKIPVTYAGGVHTYGDLSMLKELGHGKVHVTIGSALDLFGGNMKLEEVLSYIHEN
ncbi:MAG: phosphoribosylformimino-5-aminoimidazole carboxamide ribotide isomerase [Bacillus sp. (in: Bacteria)]|nr:phosphoribosylformimino-5-aminoimidazole carboxamide ribotide isomerase [Bacillus sp. (in: firmicutes)]MCM1427376.1 phosphoribosylformimino-5-aminoimidazole carboxamide ribotide isomerase [Eubacterium sp.]